MQHHSNNTTVNVYDDKRIYSRIIIATLLLNTIFIATAFSQLVTNNNVLISNTSQITVNGDILNQSGTVISNDGTIELTGDWTNNTGNAVFGTSQGTVVLNGTNQTIGGADATTFNHLTLLGSGKKKLLTDAIVGGNYISPSGILNVGDAVLDLNSKTLQIKNQSPPGITSSLGYILSEDVTFNSKIVWSMNNSTGAHTVPFGNNNGEIIPLTYHLISGNAGDVSFSTYPTAADNSPLPVYPVSVIHVNDFTGTDNSANTVDRFWLIDNNNAAVNAHITFNYGNTEQAANGNSGMVAQQWSPSNNGWNIPLPGQSNPVLNSVLVPSVTNSGIWAVAKGATPLPVKLLVYDAKAVGNKKVHNTWSTASETNNDFFTVERSKNGEDFEIVGTVKGAGNSNIPLDYTFDDLKPLQGISYYRLKQTDFNGDYAYSEMRAVNISSKDDFIVEVFPNPTIDFVNVNASQPGSFLKILDAEGKAIFASTLEKGNIKVDFTKHPAGIYTIFVSAIDGQSNKSVKLVKQ